MFSASIQVIIIITITIDIIIIIILIVVFVVLVVNYRYHILKVTCASQSKQFFLLVLFVPQLLDTKCYKNCLHVAIFNHSKKFLNIFKTGLKNWHEVIVQQSFSENKIMFRNKNLHTWMGNQATAVLSKIRGRLPLT